MCYFLCYVITYHTDSNSRFISIFLNKIGRIKTSTTYTFKNRYYAELIVKGGISCAFLITDDYRILGRTLTGSFIKNQERICVISSVGYWAVCLR